MYKRPQQDAPSKGNALPYIDVSHRGVSSWAHLHWWMGQIGEIKGGHRYFFLMCLAIYAYKCGVSKQQLRQDMKQAFDDLQDVYKRQAVTFPMILVPFFKSSAFL